MLVALRLGAKELPTPNLTGVIACPLFFFEMILKERTQRFNSLKRDFSLIKDQH